MQMTVGNDYELTKKVSSGSFGEIYEAVNKMTGQLVAVKLEPFNSKHPQLEYEAKLLAYLNQPGDGSERGIPRLYYFGRNDLYRIMVMDMLGPSLQDLFQRMNKQFDIATVALIGCQIIARLQYLHNRKFVHRDIKPENFLLGRHQHCGIVFLIDFGLSKKYLQKDGQHIAYKDNKSLTGTPRYASINSHLGIEQSRRDDLQSVMYMLIYFLKGSLPWQNLKADPAYDKYEKILERKLSVSVSALTNGLAPEFAQLIEYTCGLHFVEEPDYKRMQQLLQQAARNSGYSLTPDTLFCWDYET